MVQNPFNGIERDPTFYNTTHYLDLNPFNGIESSNVTVSFALMNPGIHSMELKGKR